jgi:hypothetical protein
MLRLRIIARVEDVHHVLELLISLELDVRVLFDKTVIVVLILLGASQFGNCWRFHSLPSGFI